MSTGSALSVPGNGAPNKNILQVFQLILKLCIFKHHIFEVSFSQVFGEAYLIVFFPETFELALILGEEGAVNVSALGAALLGL